MKAVLTTVEGGRHLFPCSLKDRANASCSLLLCEATKNDSETEDPPSRLVSLDLLKTSGELALGISLRAEHTHVLSDA